MGQTDSSTLAKVLHNPAAHHAAMAARLIAHFDGVSQPDGDVICRCPFCDHPTAGYERWLGVFSCGACGAKCDGATIGAANTIRAERALYTGPRIGALAVYLWDNAGLRSPYDDLFLETLSLDCDFCDAEQVNGPDASLYMTGIQRGSVSCPNCRNMYDVRAVMDRYRLTIPDLDEMIVHPGAVIDRLRINDAVRDHWYGSDQFDIVCPFAEHEGHARLDTALGVYWCEHHGHIGDADADHRAEFGTLGQLHDHLRRKPLLWRETVAHQGRELRC